MKIRFFPSVIFLLFSTNICFAEHQHNQPIFNSFILETDTRSSKGSAIRTWDLDGWQLDHFKDLGLIDDEDSDEQYISRM